MHLQQSKAFSLLELIISLSLLSLGLLVLTMTISPLLKHRSKIHEKDFLQNALSALESHIHSISFQDTQALLKETDKVFIYKNDSGKICLATQPSQLQQLINLQPTTIFPLQKIKIETLSPTHFTINPLSAIYLRLSGTTLHQPSDLNKRATFLATKSFIKNR